MKVTVIIPTYNGAHRLRGVLNALEQQTVKEFEVIVAVDGSTDHTLKLLQEWEPKNYRLRYYYQDNRGRAAIRNFGAKRAREESLLVFFDDDMRPLPDCLEQHIVHHKAYPGTLVAGKPIEDKEVMTTDVQKYKLHLSLRWYEPLKDTFLQKKQGLFFPAANCSLLAKDFWDLGGFDENLRDAEDYDLGMRALSSERRVYFLNDAVAYHDDFITAKSYLNRLRQYKKAHEKLSEMRSQSKKVRKVGAGAVKMNLYRLFGYPFWIDLIDKDFFWWLPRKIRFKLYDIILHSQSEYFNKVPV